MSDIMTADHNDAANDTAPESAVVKSIEISASTNDMWRALTERQSRISEGTRCQKTNLK
jgi:hypothetical protein